MIQVEIDSGSGFCFGVTTAIKKAEEELAAGKKMYCLGDIVHNGMEVERLTAMGMTTINHEQLRELHDVKVLLRAHGEPPETYELARRNNIEIIDQEAVRRQPRCTNRDLWEERTRRGSWSCGADAQSSHRDRALRRGAKARFQSRHLPLFANHEEP